MYFFLDASASKFRQSTRMTHLGSFTRKRPPTLSGRVTEKGRKFPKTPAGMSDTFPTRLEWLCNGFTSALRDVAALSQDQDRAALRSPTRNTLPCPGADFSDTVHLSEKNVVWFVISCSCMSGMATALSGLVRRGWGSCGIRRCNRRRPMHWWRTWRTCMAAPVTSTKPLGTSLPGLRLAGMYCCWGTRRISLNSVGSI